MNLPSIKTLMRIEGMEIDRAKMLRKVLECTSRDDLIKLTDKHPDMFVETTSWWNHCYNQPWVSEIKMKAADELIEGFGVECCGEVDMRNGPPLEYVNLGDTYDCTLCLFQGRYVVSSWGDIVERHERLFRDR